MKMILNDTQLFSKNIKYLRLSNKLTQEQFAKLFNKSHAAVAMWESGTRSLITADLLAIAERFNVQPVDLEGLLRQIYHCLLNSPEIAKKCYFIKVFACSVP